MRVLFVTGSDTGIGKTRVTAAIARLLAPHFPSIQIIKPVETGRAENEPGDADEAANLAHLPQTAAFTLAKFRLPAAPLAAAAAEEKPLHLPLLLNAWQNLPPADLRIVEGAGGIAVPIDPNNADWSDFAAAIQADRVILTIPDRLGAINQARLTAAYAAAQNLPAGIWLNEHQPQTAETRRINRREIARANLPIWGTQRFNETAPEEPEKSLAFLLA